MKLVKFCGAERDTEADFDLEELERLLAAGADVDTRDRWTGKTCLMLTADNGWYEASKLLINKKANVNIGQAYVCLIQGSR